MNYDYKTLYIQEQTRRLAAEAGARRLALKHKDLLRWCGRNAEFTHRKEGQRLDTEAKFVHMSIIMENAQEDLASRDYAIRQAQDLAYYSDCATCKMIRKSLNVGSSIADGIRRLLGACNMVAEEIGEEPKTNAQETFVDAWAEWQRPFWKQRKKVMESRQ